MTKKKEPAVVVDLMDYPLYDKLKPNAAQRMADARIAHLTRNGTLDRHAIRVVLERLRKRIGREHARHAKFERDARARGDGLGRERAFGEANVLKLTMNFIDEELKALAAFPVQVLSSRERAARGMARIEERIQEGRRTAYDEAAKNLELEDRALRTPTAPLSKWLLVEKSKLSGAHWLTTHANLRGVTRYQNNQEHPEDWEEVGFLDLDAKALTLPKKTKDA